jgi:UDP-N-acetyl-D-galactosamine dehydrogenase
MGMFVANKVIKMIVAKSGIVNGARVLILGFAFKENCPDTRNTKVIDIVDELKAFNIEVDVHDPWASTAAVKLEYGIDLILKEDFRKYNAVILAVSHQKFLELDYHHFKREGAIIFDTKSFISRELADARL